MSHLLGKVTRINQEGRNAMSSLTTSQPGGRSAAIDWTAVCAVCDRSRSDHRGSVSRPTCPDPETITCPECVDYWGQWVGPLSRFAAAEIHAQHEPSRRAGKEHAEWARHKPIHGLRYGVFNEPSGTVIVNG